MTLTNLPQISSTSSEPSQNQGTQLIKKHFGILLEYSSTNRMIKLSIALQIVSRCGQKIGDFISVHQKKVGTWTVLSTTLSLQAAIFRI